MTKERKTIKIQIMTEPTVRDAWYQQYKDKGFDTFSAYVRWLIAQDAKRK